MIEEWKVLNEYQKETDLVEALRTWRFSELYNAVISIRNFKRYYLQQEDIQKYNQAINTDRERSRKEFRVCQEKKGAVRSLRQCLFCYRFKLLTGKISRTCLSEECKGFEKEILDSIGKQNHKFLRF